MGKFWREKSRVNSIPMFLGYARNFPTKLVKWRHEKRGERWFEIKQSISVSMGEKKIIEKNSDKLFFTILRLAKIDDLTLEQARTGLNDRQMNDLFLSQISILKLSTRL